MCIVNLILDKIDSDKAHVFYNRNAKTFEFKYRDNIEFFTKIKKLFKREKTFIENSEEEVINSERVSEDFIAFFVKIDSFDYKRLLQEVAKYHNKILTEATTFYQTNTKTILPEERLKTLTELCEFVYFVSMYKDLYNDENYKDYAYYFYIEKT